MFGRLPTICLLCILPLSAHQAFAAHARVIYGDDDRVDYFELTDAGWRERADATVALLRASALAEQGEITKISTLPYGAGLGLCATERFYEQESAAFCSGFLIAPDLVVTAGHCVRNQAACDATRFVFGFRLESAGAQPRQVPTDRVFKCTQLLHSVAEPTGEDFAVARLDRPVHHTPPLPFRRAGKVAIGAELTVVGYPSGLPLKAASGAKVRGVEEKYLTANLDTYGGNSGSAVFNAVTGEVEGILVRGERDFILENGCRTSNRCPAEGCRGEDVTLFERVLPFLN